MHMYMHMYNCMLLVFKILFGSVFLSFLISLSGNEYSSSVNYSSLLWICVISNQNNFIKDISKNSEGNRAKGRTLQPTSEDISQYILPSI